ncbi:MAG: hypothetical protein ACRBFS_15900 [Aureispira sp.]
MSFRSFLIILFSTLVTISQAQKSVYVPSDNRDGGASQDPVRISTHVTFPDIKVLLARDIPFEDFSVGITSIRHQADYILTARPEDAVQTVLLDNCSNFPGLSILYGHNLSFPDVRIEFRDQDRGFAPDFLIYTEKTTVSEQELLACLLPLILEKARD